MFIWLLTVFIYVFFVYGIIAFIRNVYYDFMGRKSIQRNLKIEVLVEDNDDIDYILKVLKPHFGRIVFIMKEDNEEIREILEKLSNKIDIEYKLIKNISRVEKS